MATYTISPSPWLVFLDGQFIIPSGQLALYQAGTSTPATVYTSSAGTAHPFPITLDGDGRVPGGLYLQPGLSYKFVLHAPQVDEPLDGAVIKTQDHVAATPSAGGAILQLAVAGAHVVHVAGVTVVEYTGVGDVTINGLSGGTPGQELLIKNRTAFTIFLNPQEGTVPAGTQLVNIYRHGPTLIVGPRGFARYSYDGSAFWSMVGHSQGAPFVPPFDAANYGATPGMTWTVEPADVGVEAFFVEGRHLIYNFFINHTSVSGTPGLHLTRLLPLGWQAPSSLSLFTDGALVSEDGSAFVLGIATYYDGLRIAFQRGTGAPWSVTTNTTGVIGQIAFLID